jgi:Fe-S-cluster-containing hydrogenase component 2
MMPSIKHIAQSAVPAISRVLCRGCKPCEAQLACEHKAIVRIDRDEMPWVDASRCFGCRACLATCRYGAVHMVREYPQKVRAP